MGRSEAMTSVRKSNTKEEKESKLGPMDLPFLMLVMLLVGIGLVMVLSASFASSYYESGNAIFYFTKQAIFAGAGIAIMFVISRMNYQGFRGLSLFVIILAGILLVAVLIPGIGVLRNDARRWIDIKVTTFQPSELAKLGIVLYFSASISKMKDKMRTFRYGVLPYGLILMLAAVLLMMEPHLSGTVLILGVGAVLPVCGRCAALLVFRRGNCRGRGWILYCGGCRVRKFPDRTVEGSLFRYDGQRISDGAVFVCYRLWRPFGRWIGQKPTKVPVFARRAQ